MSGPVAALLPLPIVSPSLSFAVGLIALLLSAAALVLATVANRRWAQRPRARAGAEAAPITQDALAALRSQLDALELSIAELRSVEGAVAELREAAGAPDRTALRHVAVVRYDAFADVGGRLSYSLALLDDTRSGVVLTTLAGKSDVRTYVRTISAGASEGTLTDEEQQAIAAAGAPGSQQ
jgi:hypothetical protein